MPGETKAKIVEEADLESDTDVEESKNSNKFEITLQ